MLVSVWSAKGGAGSTVVSVGLAASRTGRGRGRRRDALLVDLGGDLPAVLGLAEPSVGLADWLMAGDDVGADTIGRLELATALDGVCLLPLGSLGGRHFEPRRIQQLSDALGSEDRTVVVDCGLVACEAGSPLGEVGRSVRAASAVSVLVTRPCYLAVRRAANAGARPDAVVIVREAGRALDARDVERILGAPIAAQLDIDPGIARVVDSGMLGVRPPRTLTKPLRGVA